jgi:hypothetical protein
MTAEGRKKIMLKIKYLAEGKIQVGIDTHSFRFCYDHQFYEEGIYTHYLQIGYVFICWG